MTDQDVIDGGIDLGVHDGKHWVEIPSALFVDWAEKTGKLVAPV
jgi:hypothetical protein